MVGALSVYDREVRPFSDKQIELLKNFAAQAVIAIENARLLSELRQRTGELGRSVAELRALGEVSQAVNSTLDLANVPFLPCRQGCADFQHRGRRNLRVRRREARIPPARRLRHGARS